jgi:ADP-heptose:LPS heptosyltransferase
MGDIVQTYQACLDFKEQYPDVHLTLVARESFANPLMFLLNNVFDEIITIKKGMFQNTSDIASCIEETKELVSKITKSDIDVLINFSFCETSNYLSSCLKSKNKLGTYINAYNEVTVQDQWSQVVHSMTQRGPYSPYALVDIYKNVLGINPTITNLPNEVTTQKVLAVHPFASHEKKQWKAQKWTEIIYSFLKDNPEYNVRIFGAKEETTKSNKITNEPILNKFADRITSFTGKLSVEESFNKIRECSHFIGHDSLLGHLAKVSSLPTLTIALGTVREIETIPYGENSFVLSPKTNCFPCFPDTSCSYFQCHADLSYQAVNSALTQFIGNDYITTQNISCSTSQFHLNSVNIYKSDFSNTNWLYLKELSGNQMNFRDVVKTLIRVALSYKFEEKEEQFPVPKLSENYIQKLIQLSDSTKQLYELCEFGKKYSRYILTELASQAPRVEFIKEHSNKIEEIDKLMDLIRKTQPDLASIIEYYKVTKANLLGDSLVEITESSYLVYNDNSSVCSIIYDLISSTVNNQKTKSKPGTAV